MKNVILKLATILCFLSVLPITAQEVPTELKFGEAILGEITNEEYEVGYSFTAEAGDVMFIQMVPEELLGGGVQVILLNEQNRPVASVEAVFSDAILVYQVDRSGMHSVIATRSGERTGEYEGFFRLYIDKIPVLSAGTEVSAEATTVLPAFFAVDGSEGISVQYSREGGQLNPQVSLNVMNDSQGFLDSSNLSSIIELSGSELESGTFAVPKANRLYIVRVDEGPLDFSFSTQSVNFTLVIVGEAS
jgi:hypothetical protein